MVQCIWEAPGEFLLHPALALDRATDVPLRLLLAEIGGQAFWDMVYGVPSGDDFQVLDLRIIDRGVIVPIGGPDSHFKRENWPLNPVARFE